METLTEEKQKNYKTSNYLKLEKACKEIICGKISEKEFVSELKKMQNLLEDSSMEDELCGMEELDSDELNDLVSLYVEGLDLYKEAISEIEIYVDKKDEKSINRGLKMALLANKTLLDVQEISEKKKKQLRELEYLYKGSRFSHVSGSYNYFMSEPHIINSPEKNTLLETARNKTEIFKLIPLFSVLNERELERVNQRIRLRKYKGREIVFKEGDPAEELFIIKSGEITVYKTNTEIENVAVLTKGELFGDMGIILDSARTLSVRVSSEMAELYILSKSDFLYMLKTYPDMSFHLVKIICQRLKDANDKLFKTGR
ncbi:MAG: cyclic nucleotide-binding domain-containing protein [Candidatus Eremiobacterota bacterium]